MPCQGPGRAAASSSPGCPSSRGWRSSAATATTANGCPNRSVAMRTTPLGPAAMLSGPAASPVTAAASNPVRLYLATQACLAAKKNRWIPSSLASAAAATSKPSPASPRSMVLSADQAGRTAVHRSWRLRGLPAGRSVSVHRGPSPSRTRTVSAGPPCRRWRPRPRCRRRRPARRRPGRPAWPRPK